MPTTKPYARPGRLLVACAALWAASVPSFAQTTAEAPSTSTPAPTDTNTAATKKEEPILLSKFQVSSTQGKGYTSSNSATGFKTNEELIKIPQAVTVVTRDLIDDIGAIESSNILQYAGVGNFFAGESFSMRGTRIGYPLLDEMPDGAPYLDNINLDSYTVMRGPAATLYLNASLGGTVLTTSKFPTGKEQYSVTARITDRGIFRAEGDFTAPLFDVGGAKFSYRLVVGRQQGNSFFRNVLDNRQMVHPSIQMVWKNTTIRLAYDYQQLDHIPNANNFLTPSGKLYTGAGRDEAYFAPGTMENFHRRGVRLIAIQKINDNWEAKVAATRWWFSRLGVVVFPSGGINWVNQTMTFNSRKNDQKLDYQVAQVDVNGRYHIFGLPTQTTFGASYDEEVGINRILGFPSSVFPTVIVSMSNPQLDKLTVPTLDQFTAVNPGAKTHTYRGNGYIQQTLDIVPDKLTAVVGFTRSKIKINNVTNTATGATALPIDGEETLHRYGLVYNVVKDFALYAMESTTFSPTNARDVNLNFLPSAEGKGREAGFKTAFFNGKLSSTFSVFKLTLTNQSFFSGIRPDGISYYSPIGTTTQKGFDFDVAYQPVPSVQILGSFYHGSVKDQTGADVANSYTQQESVVAKYDFPADVLKGFSVGVGYVRISGRKLAVGSYVTGIPGLVFITPEPGNLVNLFFDYKINKSWYAHLNVDNLLDEAYALGAQNSYFVDPSPPRTISTSLTYKF